MNTVIKQLRIIIPSYNEIILTETFRWQMCKPLNHTDSTRLHPQTERMLHDGKVMHSYRDIVKQYSECHRTSTVSLQQAASTASLCRVPRLQDCTQLCM